MVLIRDLTIQGVQMVLVLLLAPLFTGFVRKVKARLLRRRGPPLAQPYFDLVRLMRKDVVLADSASSAPIAGTKSFSPHGGNCGDSRGWLERSAIPRRSR